MIVNNIFIYIRTASNEEGAVSRQRSKLKEFIAELNDSNVELHVTEIADIGYNGLTNERPGITEIIERSESGEIDMLVTTDPMRLHRNLTELQKIVDKLDDFGVIVEFCDDSQILQEEDGVDVDLLFAGTKMNKEHGE